MYISEIIIDNYRNFEHIEIPLNKFTILKEKYNATSLKRKVT